MIFRLNSADATAGLGRLHTRLVGIAGMVDRAGPLMERWERIIEADNREGVLRGLDKDGNPALPLRYRPVGKVAKLTGSQRLGQRGNLRKGNLFGQGPAASGLHNNLTTSEYRKLDGPRLAPRRQFSRVITNLMTGHGQAPSDPRVWFAEGVWREVVSATGVPFLVFHFEGRGRRGLSIPKYDLRGVRPAGREKLIEALRNWARLEIREHYQAG